MFVRKVFSQFFIAKCVKKSLLFNAILRLQKMRVNLIKFVVKNTAFFLKTYFTLLISGNFTAWIFTTKCKLKNSLFRLTVCNTH